MRYKNRMNPSMNCIVLNPLVLYSIDQVLKQQVIYLLQLYPSNVINVFSYPFILGVWNKEIIADSLLIMVICLIIKFTCIKDTQADLGGFRRVFIRF